MKKIVLVHLKVLGIYLLVVTILRWELPTSFRAFFDLVGLWIGGVIGMGLLDLDRVIHVYVERPHEQLSQQVQHLVRQKQWKNAAETLMIRRGEQYHLAFRNGVFAVVFIPVLFFAFSSTAGLFGKGITAGVMLHFLYDAWRDYSKRPDYFKSWFTWMISREFTLKEQRVILLAISGVFGFMSLILL